MSLPYALMPVARQQFLDGNADPYAGGSLEFYIAGSTTPATVYSTADGSVALGTSVTLDANGYAVAIYLAPGGYKVVLKDADGVVIWTQDGVEDVATTFFDQLGVNLADGTQDVSSNYEVLVTDKLVTVASTGGADPCLIYLPSAAVHGGPLVIKNMGTVHVHVVPVSGETIENLDEEYEIPAAVQPLYPAITLFPDGVSNWWVTASHGLAHS